MLLNKGYGYADRNKRIPNTPHTRYRLGSVSKQFTAMAILILQAQSRLDVQDHLCRYIPDCPATWQEITLEHLLTHSSGLADYFVPCYSDAQKARTIIAQARNKPLAFRPGEGFSYSNVGYQLLASIVERVAGQPYGAFLQTTIFGPLDMHDSAYTPVGNRSLAVGYTSVFLKACPMDMSFEFGDSGIVSTVQDLYRWGQALDTEQLIPQSLLAEMFAPRVSMPGSVGFAGYGWVIGRQYNHRVFMHGGFIQGFKSLIARYPDDELTIVMSSNQQNYAVGSVSELVLQKIFVTEP
jgi:CubicO group peptidase (beta-lactamase class C family)